MNVLYCTSFQWRNFFIKLILHTFLVHLTSFGKPFTILTLPPIINKSYHKTIDNICIVHKYIWYIYSCK
jgi:hypothetical protein